MKKKILMLTAVFMLVCGVVSASSINGMFHSEEIVKVTANGKELKVEDVPGVLYHDRTVLPLYMFKELGVQLTWDLEKQSVDIKMPEPSVSEDVKLTAKVAFAYKTLKGLSDYVSLYDRSLGLYLDGYLSNASSPLTDEVLINRYNETANQYSSLKKIMDKSPDLFPADDSKEMQEILRRNLDAVTFYYEAVDKVIEWKTYRYSDAKRAQAALDVYFEDRKKSSLLLNDAIDRSDKKLSEKIWSIANQ